MKLEIIAKFTSRCTKCGQRINAGEKINWSREVRGVTHIKCPESVPNPNTKPVEIPVPKKAEVFHMQPEKRAIAITAYYHDGEYLSGYMVFDEKDILEKLGVASYVEGWGTQLDYKFGRTLLIENGKNFTFTLDQAEQYALPILEKQATLKFDQEMKKYQSQTNAFTQAKQTNQPVEIKKWSEECDGSTDECDIDNVIEYAMPNGSTTTKRYHTY